MMFELFFFLSAAQEEITKKISQKPRMNGGGLRKTQQVLHIRWNKITYFINSARLIACIKYRLQEIDLVKNNK